MRLEGYSEEKHGQMLQQWWHSKHALDFNLDLLSETGVLAYVEDVAIAAAFLYLTNSKVAWIGWPVSDPESSKELRDVALNEIFENLHQTARDYDYTLIWTVSGIPALQKRYEELGYLLGDENVNQYFKPLRRGE